MNCKPLILPAICAGVCLCSCSTQHQLNAREATEYARYAQNHGSVAANLRRAAAQAAEIAGEFKDVRSKKIIRVPMSEKEQQVVRRLFSEVEAPPLLEPSDWYEYERYRRNMISPTPPACFCDIVFLAANGKKLESETLFESPWTDIGNKKDAANYRKFEDGSDMGDKINGRYIPQILADSELIQQFQALPVMDKLSKLAKDCYAGK